MNREDAEKKAKEYLKGKPWANDPNIIAQTIQYFMESE